MKLWHYLNRRTEKSQWRSRYSIVDEDGATLFDTGSSVQIIRKLRRAGAKIPDEMNRPQKRGYKVEIEAE